MDAMEAVAERQQADAPFDAMLKDAGGLRRVDRRVFSDPGIYEREFAAIWERVWILVGHESQLLAAQLPHRLGWAGSDHRLAQ